MTGKDALTEENLQQWFREKLGAETGIDPSLISLDTPFSDLKLDSLSMVSLSYELETHSGLSIDPTVFFEFDTPNKLAQWVQLQIR